MLGIGLDIVAVRRVEAAIGRRGDALLQRLLAPAEAAELRARGPTAPALARYVAGRFAAKEAVAKALGTGIGALGFRNIEVTGRGRGPTCRLRGPAAVAGQRAGVGRVLLSITHDAGVAAAVAVTVAAATDGPAEQPIGGAGDAAVDHG